MPEAATLKKSAGWTTVAFGDVVQLSKERSSDPEADGYERYIGLEHIVLVDATGQSRIQTKTYHLPQSLPMLRKGSRQRLFVPLF